MISPLYFTRIVPLATALLCAVIAFNQLAAAAPLNVDPLLIEHKRHCSTDLVETIALICAGRTRSLMDNYPQSFGQRIKRLSNATFFRPLQTGPTHDCCRHACGYTELRQYCAPD